MPEHATVTRPRSRTAPIGPRRISGPSRQAIAAGPAIRGRTSAFEKISRIPDHRVIDSLLRGRACILIIGLMLGGIVAMQVSLLRLNSGISRAVQTQSTLAAQNMALESQIAEASSGDSVIAAAAAAGMIDPPAGDRRFLTARPATDPARAARRMKLPSLRAIEIMNNGGMVPGALAAAGTPAAALAAQLNGQPAPTAAPTVAPTTAQTAAVPTATAAPVVPAPTAAPVVPAPTVAPTAPGTGAATTDPQG